MPSFTSPKLELIHMAFVYFVTWNCSTKQKKRKFDFFQACRESVYCLDFARIPCYKLILRLKLIASD